MPSDPTPREIAIARAAIEAAAECTDGDAYTAALDDETNKVERLLLRMVAEQHYGLEQRIRTLDPAEIVRRASREALDNDA